MRASVDSSTSSPVSKRTRSSPFSLYWSPFPGLSWIPLIPSASHLRLDPARRILAALVTPPWRANRVWRNHAKLGFPRIDRHAHAHRVVSCLNVIRPVAAALTKKARVLSRPTFRLLPKVAMNVAHHCDGPSFSALIMLDARIPSDTRLTALVVASLLRLCAPLRARLNDEILRTMEARGDLNNSYVPAPPPALAVVVRKWCDDGPISYAHKILWAERRRRTPQSPSVTDAPALLQEYAGSFARSIGS